MKLVNPILHDLKDGSLKRVRKSTYKESPQKEDGDDYGLNLFGKVTTVPTSPTPDESNATAQELLRAVSGEDYHLLQDKQVTENDYSPMIVKKRPLGHHGNG